MPAVSNATDTVAQQTAIAAVSVATLVVVPL